MTLDPTAPMIRTKGCFTDSPAPLHAHPLRLRSRVLLLTLLLPFSLRAQSRLEQMEATYQTNLRALHAPLLQDYIRQLELVKSQLIARNRVAESKHVDAEIARVKTIVSTTGVLPYSELEAALTPAAPANGSTPKIETIPPSSPAKQDANKLPTLLAAEAKGAEISGKTGAIPVGSAEWRISKLPAGTYDVLMIFASEALALPEQITLNLGGQEFKASVGTDRATGSPESFRLLRLCQIKLDTEVSNSTLTLTTASTTKPLLWVKKLMFVTPKKPATGAQ